jgi:hypothetical protein
LSRYFANKLMRMVISDPDRLESFKADPELSVRQFRQRGVNELTDQEAQALSERDCIALYALGCHPFLLWTFTEFVWTPELGRDEVVACYKRETAAHGWPDFTT